MSETSRKEEKESLENENELKPIQFKCSTCFLEEQCDYFGLEPTFVKGYKLLENAYVMKDPFVDPRLGNFIILGSHCIKCNNVVCKDTSCSIYYNGSYCIKCAKDCFDAFPLVLQEKINKNLPR